MKMRHARLQQALAQLRGVSEVLVVANEQIACSRWR